MNRTIFIVIFLGGLLCSQLGADDAQPSLRPRPEGALRLKLRTRVETFKGSGEWDEVNLVKEVPVAEVAIIICDMWDKHWCEGATERCGALAEKMAPVIKAARAKGIQIIHAPSETMNFYQDTPQRRRVLLAPRVEMPKPLEISTRGASKTRSEESLTNLVCRLLLEKKKKRKKYKYIQRQ